MPSGYAVWIGQPVVLQVETGNLRVPLRGTILGESHNALRFRISDGWELDIFKAMVVGVEEDNWLSLVS